MEDDLRREGLIDLVSEYFKPQELVGPRVYNKFRDNSWFVMDTDLLKCLFLIRVGLGKPITINNWHKGGNFDERGYRDNTQDIVRRKGDRLYVSGHVLGSAVDFTVKGMTAEEVRDWIEDNQEMFPCKIRLEWKKDGVPISWVHLDTKWFKKNPKVYKFNV